MLPVHKDNDLTTIHLIFSFFPIFKLYTPFKRVIPFDDFIFYLKKKQEKVIWYTPLKIHKVILDLTRLKLHVRKPDLRTLWFKKKWTRTGRGNKLS